MSSQFRAKINLNKGGTKMYKNWKAICQITDTHFMWALALLDLATDFGRMVAERFPEYFSSEQQAGPIPLSIIKMRACQNTQREVGKAYDDYPVTYHALDEFDVPIIEFWDQGENPLPHELEELIKGKKQGDTIIWKGKRITLIEDNPECGTYFIPAELIAVDK